MMQQWNSPFHFPIPALWRQSISITIREDPFELTLHDGREVAPVDGCNKGETLGIFTFSH
jgi:hypothetical protein